MSVVYSQPSGWILDHLSFINNCTSQLCHSHDHSAWATLDDNAALSNGNLIVAASLHNTNSWEEGSGMKAAGGKLHPLQGKKYVFREEFFNVFKPHILGFETELCQKNSQADLKNGVSEEQEGAKSDEFFSTIKAKKKRKRSSEVNQGEHDALEYHLKVRDLILNCTRSLVLKSGFFQCSRQCSSTAPVPRHSDCDLAEFCEMAKQFSPVTEGEETICTINDKAPIPAKVRLSCVMENTTNHERIIELMGQKYFFSPKSAFLLSDISLMQPLLDYNKKFGIIVIDPPWENKSVKRSKRYSYLSHWQIKQLPVPALAAPDCLVVTWVTNRQKHLRFVKSELYPFWSVHGIVEWFWVKVTRSGEFIFPLDSFHKKPYEILVLGRVQGHTDIPLRVTEDDVPSTIPDRKLIVSVPCILHSHKPPLTEILKQYSKPGVECLELFARNLQPGWTSWGNEVLKFQHMDYFTAVQNKCD